MNTRSCIISLLVLFVFSVGTHAQTTHAFHLSEVKLLDGPFLHAQKLGEQYILAHDADRLLAPFLIDAGLETKAQRYSNWENTGLDGHTGGHYLTALAQMVVVSDNPEFKKRLDYMLDELERCQIKNGDGYVGGIPGGHEMWKQVAEGRIRAGSFSLNDKWVPLYNIHKLYAGLRDAYLLAGSEKAKVVLIKLSDWFIETTKNLTDEQMQNMLRSEHGGMNEVFADVAAITSDLKYLDLAKRLSHRTLLDPLLQHHDKLNGMHANTQIPKVIGFERVAEVANDSSWHNAADFFWKTVVENRSVAIGGNSVREHFHPSTDFSSMMETKEGPESCNTYNMLRLSRQLFLYNRQNKYIDYYERALYNHILSTQHPDHGGYVYFTPMRPRHYRVYSQPEQAFWCCVGSGMENHGKYGELIYAHAENNVYVNLYIPSVLTWKEMGLKLTQKTRFPDEEQTELALKLDKSKQFTINIRYPEWIKRDAMKIFINGKSIKVDALPGQYVNLIRTWKNGDKIKVTLPMHDKLEQLPDGSDYAAILHGPIVLAANTGNSDLVGLLADDSRMGHIANGPSYPVDEAPVLLIDNLKEPLTLKRIDANKMVFEVPASVYPEKYKTLKLEPFYRLHDARYMIYWPISTREKLEAKQKALKEKENLRLAIEAQTIDMVTPGEQQPESDHNFKSESSESGVYRDRHWRHAAGWFSYDLKDPKKEAKKLRITYNGGDSGRTFEILLNDKLLATVTLDGSFGDRFADVEYQIPYEMVSEKMTLKFKAKPGSIAGGIFEVRLLR